MKTVAARKKAGPFLYERWFEGGGLCTTATL